MSRLDDIQARHDAWYSGDDTTAQWPDDLGFVESYEHDRDSTPRTRAMAHEITREDVPFLLDRARKQQAALDAVRELHVAEGNGNCITCWDFNADSDVRWPCPTARALEANP